MHLDDKLPDLSEDYLICNIMHSWVVIEGRAGAYLEEIVY